jgi:C-terminal processing protease CtpA/Prc
VTSSARSIEDARAGRPLHAVLPPAAAGPWLPVQLTVTQRHDLIDHWTALFTDVYVHYSQKRALYGFDPVRALSALRRQIPYLDSAAFLRELTLLVNRLRDQHTQLYVRALDASLEGCVAALPFLVEVFGPHLSPTFIVTKVSDDVGDADFRAGARVTTWNAVPFARAVDLYAETLTGGRPDARRARALLTLTQRPLDYVPPPDERWVEMGYRRADDSADAPDRTIRFEWRVIQPAKALTADTRISTRTRRAINVTAETARRARKMLFATRQWAQDQLAAGPVAKDDSWVPTLFPDALSARALTTASGTFGYLRLWTFDVEHGRAYVDEVIRVLGQLPDTGLILDLRGNPGGVIDTAEQLLQLFTPNRVVPIGFGCRATRAMAAITDADGNGADLADWAASTRASVELGEEFSQHLPVSDPDDCNQIGRRYNGPVVAVVDANTFSSGDLFAAGIADHDIGTIVSVGDATGAGGANVWASDDLEYAYHAARLALPPLPPGISYSIAMRRMVRTGPSIGVAIEDVGVRGDEHYELTETDVVDGNADLLEVCGRLLAGH